MLWTDKRFSNSWIIRFIRSQTTGRRNLALFFLLFCIDVLKIDKPTETVAICRLTWKKLPQEFPSAHFSRPQSRNLCAFILRIENDFRMEFIGWREFLSCLFPFHVYALTLHFNVYWNAFNEYDYLRFLVRFNYRHDDKDQILVRIIRMKSVIRMWNCLWINIIFEWKYMKKSEIRFLTICTMQSFAFVEWYYVLALFYITKGYRIIIKILYNIRNICSTI